MSAPLADVVRRLETVLSAEERLYLRLREVLRREESELLGLDASELEATVAEKRALAEEAKLLEESRRIVMVELGVGLGLGEEPVKLSRLIAQLGPEAGGLPGLHGRLRALVGSTRALLEGNERFASRSLVRVQETLRMLGRAIPEETVGYGRRLRSSGQVGRGRLVRQAI